MVVVAWADARLASSRVCCCLPSGWRRVCLQLDGRRLRCGAHPLLLLPSSQAAPISSEEARRPEPHAWTVHTPQPPRGSWLLRLCVHPTVWLLAAENEAERELWLREIEDGIQLSHGEGSPYHAWRFGGVLGEGSFGVCRSAEHRASGQRCACKLLSRSSMAQEARDNLEREITILRRLEARKANRATLRLVDTMEFGDHIYLFLSPECAGDLTSLIVSEPSDEQSAGVVRAMLCALGQMHAAGVCHLDVKPQNVLWTHHSPPDHPADLNVGGRPARVFLGDFGSARELPIRNSCSEVVSRGGWPPLSYDGCGSLHFLPPESLEEGLMGTASDVWAVGCVAFMMLLARHPFFMEVNPNTKQTDIRRADSQPMTDTMEMVKLRILRGAPLYSIPGQASTVLSSSARECLDQLMRRRWEERCSAHEALSLGWLAKREGYSQPEEDWTTISMGELNAMDGLEFPVEWECT